MENVELPGDAEAHDPSVILQVVPAGVVPPELVPPGQPSNRPDQPEASLRETPRQSPRPPPRRSLISTPLPSPEYSPIPSHSGAQPTYAPVSSCSKKSISLTKWGIFFDGHSCVRSFFLSVDECITAYDVTQDYVLRRFHELLRGYALKYFRTIREPSLNFETLRCLFFRTFSPVDFDAATERDLRNCKQKAGQSIMEFIVEVKSLNSMLSSPIPDSALLPILKYNLHPRYSLCLSTNRISDINTLIEIATNFESYDRKALQVLSVQNPGPSSVRSGTGSPADSTLCAKCAKPGHSFRSCPNLPGIVCFRCKKPGFVTRQCPECNRDRKN